MKKIKRKIKKKKIKRKPKVPSFKNKRLPNNENVDNRGGMAWGIIGD